MNTPILTVNDGKLEQMRGNDCLIIGSINSTSNITVSGATVNDSVLLGNVALPTTNGTYWQAMQTNGSNQTSWASSTALLFGGDIRVETTGNDANADGTANYPFATIDGAMNYARQFRAFASTPYTNILLGAGTYTITSTINLNHPEGRGITVYSDSYTSRTINNVNVTGSNGSLNLIFTVNSAANINVNETCVVTSVSGGGTNYQECEGAYRITAVNTSNNTVTCLSRLRWGGPTNGAISGSFQMQVYKTNLVWGGANGGTMFELTDGHELAYIGYLGAYDSSQTATCVKVSRLSRLLTSAPMAICDFNIGVDVEKASMVTPGQLIAANSYCVRAMYGSQVLYAASRRKTGAQVTGYHMAYGTAFWGSQDVSGCANGIAIEYKSLAYYSHARRCSNYGWKFLASEMMASGATIAYGCGSHGFYLQASRVHGETAVQSLSSSYNGGSGYYVTDQSAVRFVNALGTYNTGWGIYLANNSFGYETGGTFTNNTTGQLSPAKTVSGNVESYMW